MNNETVKSNQEFYWATTALEKVAMEIVGFQARMTIRMITDGSNYHFRLDIDGIDSADMVRAAHYLNHKMKVRIAQNHEALLPITNEYLRMNTEMAAFFMDDLLEDWLAGEFVKHKDEMTREYRLYSRSPYMIPNWEVLNVPLTEGNILEYQKMGDKDIGAMILTPGPITLNDEMQKLLNENVNYHAGVHLNENFRRITSVYCANARGSEDAVLASVGSRIRRSLARGIAIILFFESKGGKVKYRPYAFDVLGL
ncbi:hypothetical protein WCX18_10950 [Sulfurimonas sp. HSL1-2]|uniref:hypothetical protein n=1 Tax=Thiomicrolovo zhangzhouensis TaxID=3131933 RepID=UPI0031F872DA